MRNLNENISGWRKMVLFVMFDLPTGTRRERRRYTEFRKALIGEGFIMLQYSIYIRFCRSLAIAQRFEKKISRIAPDNGSIRVMKVTEAQYSNILIIENYREKPEKKLSEQTQTLMVF